MHPPLEPILTVAGLGSGRRASGRQTGGAPAFARAALCVGVLAWAGLAGAAGPSFAERVRQAKRVEDSPDGKAYQALLWKAIGDDTATLMMQCFKDSDRPDTDFFTLVADVRPDLSASGVEARPQTPMTQCFAERFGRLSFPAPPARFGEAGMPLVIDMKITP